MYISFTSLMAERTHLHEFTFYFWQSFHYCYCQFQSTLKLKTRTEWPLASLPSVFQRKQAFSFQGRVCRVNRCHHRLMCCLSPPAVWTAVRLGPRVHEAGHLNAGSPGPVSLWESHQTIHSKSCYQLPKERLKFWWQENWSQAVEQAVAWAQFSLYMYCFPLSS